MKLRSPTITLLSLLMKVGILLIWDNKDPLAINLGQLITTVQTGFFIKMHLALRTMCFQASPLLLLSGSPLDTSTGI